MEEKRVSLAHGAGGVIMSNMIKKQILKYFSLNHHEVTLNALDDAGITEGIVFTTDSYTVKPLFFPGGNIGVMSVAGTVNDIAVMGGEPLVLSCSMIIEEGFSIEELDLIIKSIQETCIKADVDIITGDTKVLERKALDKLIINTSGVGKKSQYLEKNLKIVKRYKPNFKSDWLLDSNIEKGDKIIISGTLGDHGVAIMSARNEYGLESQVESDVAPLNNLIKKALDVGGIVSIKDPTRGGLANLLNEWSEKSKIGFIILENEIPVKDSVRSALGFLGLDVLEIGNEGKICLATIPEKAEEVLGVLRELPEGRDAMIIGEATDEFDLPVLETQIGGRRILAKPAGDPIPRIC